MPDGNGKLSSGVEKDSLRKEIIESEKSQADFLKWKFIVIAAVGSFSLGFTSSGGSPTQGSQMLLCFLPLLCAYVDMISLHLMGRIITLGNYLRRTGSSYEQFVFEIRGRTGANPYFFEALALHGSSFALNILLIGLGFLLPKAPSPVPSGTGQFQWDPDVLTAYKVAGILGLGITVVLVFGYKSTRKKIDRICEEFFRPKT